MPIITCTPLLKCPFCSSKNLTLFRTGVLGFDKVDEGEQHDSVPVIAPLLQTEPFLFLSGVRCADIGCTGGLAS